MSDLELHPNRPNWIRVSDFRPGIHSNVTPLLGPAPAHAQEEGTWGCMADTNGSLVPGPRVAQRITRAAPTSNLFSEEVRITGLFNNGGMFSAEPSNLNVYGVEEDHSEIWAAFEYYTGTAGNATRVSTVARYSRNKQSPSWRNVRSQTRSGLNQNPVTRPAEVTFASQRSNENNPLQAGPQVVVWAMNGEPRMFPSDTDPGGTGTVLLPRIELIEPTQILAHQGRVIFFMAWFTANGPDQLYVSNEPVYWSKVNQLREVGSRDIDDNPLWLNLLGSGGYETGYGYGAFASLTADELFLVKTDGGAILVAGDLNNPSSVRFLPFVQPTGLAMNLGLPTSLGFMYPVDNSGMWIWTGGDTSEHMTPQLRGEFWRPPPHGPAQAPVEDRKPNPWGHGRTSMAEWGQWIMVPNNWLFDGDTKGWWRVVDPDRPDIAFHRWTSDVRNRRAYAAPSGYRAGEPCIWEFERTTRTNRFSWRSHPLNFSFERNFTVEEMVVCAVGQGTVYVTLETDTEPNRAVAQIQFRAEHKHLPRLLRSGAVHASGANLVLKVESVADNPAGEAPTVHWIDLAGRPGNQYPIA